MAPGLKAKVERKAASVSSETSSDVFEPASTVSASVTVTTSAAATTTAAATAAATAITPPIPAAPTMDDPGEGTSAMATTAPAAPAAPAATITTTEATPATTTITATAMSLTTTTTMAATAGYENTLAPPPFRGMSGDDGEAWLSRFEKYVLYRGFPDREKLNLLAVLLRDNASDWFDTLTDAQKSNWGAMRTAFKERFQDSDLLRWQKASAMWNRFQAPEESVDMYVTTMRKLAKAVGIQGDQLRYAIQRGLKPQLLGHVIQEQPTSVDELVQAARVAEAAFQATAAAHTAVPLDRVVEELAANRLAAEQNTLELKKFTNQLTRTSINQIRTSRSPSPPGSTRRVSFGGSQTQEQQRPQQPTQQERGRGFNRRMPMNNRAPTSINCDYCGGKHPPGRQFCRAANVECFVCRKVGHLAKVCRSARRQQGAAFGYNPGGRPNFSA